MFVVLAFVAGVVVGAVFNVKINELVAWIVNKFTSLHIGG